MPRSDELSIRAGEAMLAATLLLPDEPPPLGRRGRYPVVLLLPSWLPRDRDGGWDRIGHASWFAPERDRPGLLGRVAVALAERGVASLRADPRGCGRSDGSWEAVTLFTRIDDARDLLAALRGSLAIDLRRTGIVGHGEGAGIALALAIGDPAVSALTLVGGSARSWSHILRWGAARRGRDATDHRHPIVAGIDRWSEELLEHASAHAASVTIRLPGVGPLVIPVAGLEQAVHTPPIALATMLHRSVSLVHGTADAWSDPDETRLLASALAAAGQRPAIRLVPGADHDLSQASDALIGELADELIARIAPQELPPVLLAIEEMG